VTGLKGFGSTRHGLGANCEPGGGGLHGCAFADSCVFERSQPAQMAAMVAGGLANWVLPKSIVDWLVGMPGREPGTRNYIQHINFKQHVFEFIYYSTL